MSPPGAEARPTRLLTAGFFDWARGYDDAGTSGRSRARHGRWWALLPCPVLGLDSAGPVPRLLDAVTGWLNSAPSTGEPGLRLGGDPRRDPIAGARARHDPTSPTHVNNKSMRRRRSTQPPTRRVGASRRRPPPRDRPRNGPVRGRRDRARSSPNLTPQKVTTLPRRGGHGDGAVDRRRAGDRD